MLDALVQHRRDAAAAKRFLVRLLAKLGSVPRAIVTDGLRSRGAARREAMAGVAHRRGRWMSNRAEESHRPRRRRERQMQRFKSAARARCFLAAHGIIRGHFRPPRARTTADERRRARARALRVWRRETCAQQPV